MVMNPADVGTRPDVRSTGWPDNITNEALYALGKQAIQEARGTEKHIHTRERWCGIAVPQTATVWADVASLVPYIAVTGAVVFGGAIQIIGTDDMPALTDHTRYDSHRILVTDMENVTPWIMRLIWGSGTVGDAEAAGQFSDIMIMATSPGPPIRPQGVPVDVLMPRLISGLDKLWAKVKNATNLDEIEFFIGTHEYDDPI